MMASSPSVIDTTLTVTSSSSVIENYAQDAVTNISEHDNPTFEPGILPPRPDDPRDDHTTSEHTDHELVVGSGTVPRADGQMSNNNYTASSNNNNQHAKNVKKLGIMILVIIVVLVLWSAVSVGVVVAIDDFTKATESKAVFRYLLWDKLYGVLLPKAEGSRHNELNVETSDVFPIQVDIALASYVATGDTQQIIANTTVPNDPSVNAVYALSHYTYSVNVTAPAGTVINATVHQYNLHNEMKQVCTETIIVPSDSVTAPYSCSVDQGGYYQVHYDVPIHAPTVRVSGRIKYDSIDTNSFNRRDNCSVPKNNQCSFALAWNKDYKVVALVHPLVSLTNDRHIKITRRSRNDYYIYIGFGSGIVYAAIIITSIILIVSTLRKKQQAEQNGLRYRALPQEEHDDEVSLDVRQVEVDGAAPTSPTLQIINTGIVDQPDQSDSSTNKII